MKRKSPLQKNCLGQGLTTKNQAKNFQDLMSALDRKRI